MYDARTSNTVTYGYDLLKRVTSATATGGTAWSQTFGYDGFGNLTSKSVPAGLSEFPLPGVNAQKNQLLGSTYDNNGNVLTLNNATLAYDVENRLTSYTASGGFVENYAYDEGNRRVEKWNNSGQAVSDNVYFYGPDGKLLSVLNVNITGSSPWFTLSTSVNRIYFGGMVLGSSSGYATADTKLLKDRLGSARPAYPYGTDISSGVSEGDDFATYWQDYHTGFEYAMNRYYSAGYGRFLTVDRFGGSAHKGNPGTWNRYAYAGGDPVNSSDPSGLCSANYSGICDGGYCPPEVQYCDPGPPGTEYGVNDPSQPNCGNNPQFVDGDAGETTGDGDGCDTPIVPPPPPPSCTIEVFDRPIEALHGLNLPGARHGFILFVDPDGSDWFGEGVKNGKTLSAYFGNAGGQLPLDLPLVDKLDGEESGSQICAWQQLLQSDAGEVNNSNYHYHWYGPNSSSVLRYMLESLPDTSWFNMPWMIGYGSSLPGLN